MAMKTGLLNRCPDVDEEEEQVFIATAKGRNGRKSPYTQLLANSNEMKTSGNNSIPMHDTNAKTETGTSR